MKTIHECIFLTTKQGCSTSVAASVLDDLDPDTVYLQPYHLPFRDKNKSLPPSPMFEILGPYAGYVEGNPRLSIDGVPEGVRACLKSVKSWLDASLPIRPVRIARKRRT